MKSAPVLSQTCKRCGATFPPSHFKPNRKSCRTCLEGAPLPQSPYVVLPYPRSVRRWWPDHVVAHQPAQERTGPCPTCGQDFKRKRLDQVYCCRTCRVRKGRGGA